MFNDPLFTLLIIAWAMVLIVAGIFVYRSLMSRNIDSAPVPTARTNKSLSNLTSHDIQRIGEKYGLNLTGEVNSTPGRLLWLFVFAAGYLLFGMIVMGIVTPFFGLNVFPYYPLLSLAVTVFLAALTLGLFIVNVPKFTGLITTNYFSGTLHIFGPGIHIKYPWEHYSMEDYIDTRAISVEKSSRFNAKGSIMPDSTPDGAIGLTFTWTVQYGPFLPLLALYVRTEEKAIEDGFKEVVENALNEAMSSFTIQQMLDKNTIEALQKKLGEAFRGEERDDVESTLEERFGIAVELNTLGPPTFDKDYTEALSGQVVRGIMMRDAKAMKDDLSITGEKAFDNVMMINKESVTKSIITLQADDNLRDSAKDLGEVLRTTGVIGRVVESARGNKTRGAGKK